MEDREDPRNEWRCVGQTGQQRRLIVLNAYLAPFSWAAVVRRHSNTRCPTRDKNRERLRRLRGIV
jgi:hypothetical protein